LADDSTFDINCKAMANPDIKLEKRSKSHVFTLTAIGAFVLLVVWFTLQNADPIRFQFAVWGWTISLALLLFTCVFIGIVLACLAVLPAFLSERRFRKRAEKHIRELVVERDELRKRIAMASTGGADASAAGRSLI
jgi:uncharacterized integral membrane protein